MALKRSRDLGEAAIEALAGQPLIHPWAAYEGRFSPKNVRAGRPKLAAPIDARDILIPAALTGDLHFAIQLELIITFGLSAREAWLFRPHLIGKSGRDGKSRTLAPTLTPIQMFVLQRARNLVKNVSGSMIPADYRLDQWAQHFYGLCRTIGLTSAAMGVTAQGLRQGVLLNFLEEMQVSWFVRVLGKATCH